MFIFYDPDLNEHTDFLDRESSHHAIRVLRLNKGEMVRVTDGHGSMARVEIIEANPEQCSIRIRELVHSYRKRPYHLHVALAPTKSSDRFEWFLEKATEIGIDEITPLLCDHSERKQIRHERSVKILQTAMLQAGHAFLPVLHPMARFQDFLKVQQGHAMYIAHCKSAGLPHLVQKTKPGEDAIVFIGPEGDFSEAEIARARQQGALDVSLGSSRLRTETAGLVACHTFEIINHASQQG